MTNIKYNNKVILPLSKHLARENVTRQLSKGREYKSWIETTPCAPLLRVELVLESPVEGQMDRDTIQEDVLAPGESRDSCNWILAGVGWGVLGGC